MVTKSFKKQVIADFLAKLIIFLYILIQVVTIFVAFIYIDHPTDHTILDSEIRTEQVFVYLSFISDALFKLSVVSFIYLLYSGLVK